MVAEASPEGVNDTVVNRAAGEKWNIGHRQLHAQELGGG